MPDTAAPIQVRSLDHVTLVVRDLEQSKSFYCGVLGMDDVPRPAFSFAGKWFQAGNTQIHLISNLTPTHLPTAACRRQSPWN